MKRENVRQDAEDDENLACSKCSKVLSSKRCLNRHLATHFGHFKYYCEECRKGYQNKCDYDQHMSKHEGRTFPCELCSKRFANKKTLHAHQAEHTGNYPHTCSHCQRGFIKKSSWEELENQHAGIKFSCRKCGKDFYLTSKRDSHEKTCNKL